MKLALLVVPAVLLALCLGAALWLYTPDRSRAWLERRYLTPDDSYREAAGLRLFVRDTGPRDPGPRDPGPRDAPAVILLHGFGASLQTWEPWAAALSGRTRVIRFDLPGFGLTGPDPTGDYSDARGIAVLAALMDTLGVARADLIGNSMGGKLAWGFAAAHPERVGRLVLVSPDGFASPGFEYDKTPKVPAVVRLLPYTLPRVLVRMSLAPAYADKARLTAATVSRYRDMMLAPGVRPAMLDRLRQVRLRDPTPVLRRIETPTLLLWGEQDGMIPFSNAADYLRAMPHAELAPLPGLGHVPFEEAPDVALPPVLAFLARGP